MLHANMTLTYNEYPTSLLHLERDEWTLMITAFIAKLKTKPVGETLVNRLYQYLDMGYSLNVLSYDKDAMRSIIFPSSRQISSCAVNITIPSISYFIEVDTVDVGYLEKLKTSENNLYNLDIYDS